MRQLLLNEVIKILSNKKYNKYTKYKSQNKITDSTVGKNTKMNIIIAIAIGIVVIVALIIMNPTHLEALDGYTETNQQLIGTYDLVPEDSYYVGTGTLNGIVHARFEARQNGKISDTVDVTKKFFKIVHKDVGALNGKVEAYKRTYKKGSDIKTHFYYVLYVDSSSKIKDCGTLSTDEDDSDD
ncbi:hypothetical protein SAMN02745134_02393 [Clostridium acidisoli DSM 12555]|uniref:Uncharacterized protein n=1 Tax=Clostridium acidisoli DSM 12555 TaxID=1121291 RepID=A0A1W1XMK5_9CLOT|nr:hypothetical protein SAMN02745134_02393 [Clostridium acidisoli DSM 12555]